MPTFNVAGVDVGFCKTGITVFQMTPDEDKLIAATTIEPQVDGSTVVHKDVTACFDMIEGIVGFLTKHDVKALFLEFPSGGSQSGRASRCMGMATAISAAILKCYEWDFGYEIYTPTKIEILIGIRAPIGSKAKLSHGQKRADKKEALKEFVLEKYPDDKFRGWPRTKALAEDAYDSAAAFLAARVAYGEEGLYQRLRAICEGSSQQKVDS